MNRMAAVAYASYASAPFHRIANEGTVDEAAEELAAIVEGR
jgi:adenylate kinase